MKIRAFTLVHVLIILVITAIVLAIILPSLRRQTVAMRPYCLSNVKQIGLGLIIYANDYDNELPLTENARSVRWMTTLYPYTKNTRLFICPEDEGATNSYGANQLVFPTSSTHAKPAEPRQKPSVSHSDADEITGVVNGANTILIGEVGTTDDFTTPIKNAYLIVPPTGILKSNWEARPAPRHNMRSSVAFVDGHAKAMKLEDFYFRQSPADKWFCKDSSSKECH